MKPTLHIFPVGALSCEQYTVEKETAQAVCLKRDCGKFPVWVPRAAIVSEKTNITGSVVELLHFASWFSPEKPWQKMSLGFTC